jgi:hypothetical protein
MLESSIVELRMGGVESGNVKKEMILMGFVIFQLPFSAY